ncbi:uncharacterized protein EAF01_008292 [Botrytis porri]|uniref:Uncharacterized protein n=1 Tax=Botrytis porri TaxID=87229 RepID=A0A4Z1KPU5_9HELO|nr:uncharacterized protein EAF01_008292 [Botrytis porri]KAF7899079.1 hypothetical protein EAF01_008292 [Botrytis porri]TGO87516.1 hypothetical protein BPOR_0221g00130 [Botrytis porri]
MAQVMMPMTPFNQNENGTPPRPLSRRKKREAEAVEAAAVVLSEDRRRALEATYNGANAGEAREKLLQNPAMSLGPGLHLPSTEDKTYNLLTHFRVPGPELVNKSVPSCGLPSGWSDKHDRCIAYLSTHAPLLQGKVPKQEALQPRYTTRETSSFILKRFPELCGHRIKESIIELRLELLDRSENSYFSIEYGGYSDHEWARGI